MKKLYDCHDFMHLNIIFEDHWLYIVYSIFYFKSHCNIAVMIGIQIEKNFLVAKLYKINKIPNALNQRNDE